MILQYHNHRQHSQHTAKDIGLNFTYFQRTIEDFGDYLTPIEELLANTFIPTLFGRKYEFSSYLRSLFTLPTREGGLGISSPTEESKQQFEGSIHVTKPHVEAIISQEQGTK